MQIFERLSRLCLPGVIHSRTRTRATGEVGPADHAFMDYLTIRSDCPAEIIKKSVQIAVRPEASRLGDSDIAPPSLSFLIRTTTLPFDENRTDFPHASVRFRGSMSKKLGMRMGGGGGLLG